MSSDSETKARIDKIIKDIALFIVYNWHNHMPSKPTCLYIPEEDLKFLNKNSAQIDDAKTKEEADSENLRSLKVFPTTENDLGLDMTSEFVVGHGTPENGIGSDEDYVADAFPASRLINNVMRHDYRVLDDYEKDEVVQLKDIGLDFITLLYEIAGYEDMPPEGSSFRSRELALAAQKMEEAVMWSIKGISK